MPKTATGKVQRRHVATAMIATEKKGPTPEDTQSPQETAPPTANSAPVQTPDQLFSVGWLLISRIGSFCRGSLSFVQGAKKSKALH